MSVEGININDSYRRRRRLWWPWHGDTQRVVQCFEAHVRLQHPTCPSSGHGPVVHVRVLSRCWERLGAPVTATAPHKSTPIKALLGDTRAGRLALDNPEEETA